MLEYERLAPEVKYEPCPFCGGEAELRSEIIHEYTFTELTFLKKWRVRCRGCGCGTCLCSQIDFAELDWNRRVRDD